MKSTAEELLDFMNRFDLIGLQGEISFRDEKKQLSFSSNRRIPNAFVIADDGHAVKNSRFALDRAQEDLKESGDVKEFYSALGELGNKKVIRM